MIQEPGVKKNCRTPPPISMPHMPRVFVGLHHCSPAVLIRTACMQRNNLNNGRTLVFYIGHTGQDIHVTQPHHGIAQPAPARNAEKTIYHAHRTNHRLLRHSQTRHPQNPEATPTDLCLHTDKSTIKHITLQTMLKQPLPSGSLVGCLATSCHHHQTAHCRQHLDCHNSQHHSQLLRLQSNESHQSHP